MEFLKKNIGYLMALFGLGFFIYSFNLNGLLFWDDADWILNNPVLHAFTWENIKFIFSHDVLAGIGQVSNYYRPFLFLTFLFDYIVFGSNPVWYHIISNGIHIINACLIFYLLMRWLKSKRIAFLTSFLFLIHPLQTEAVTYISGRGDPLSIFFILISIALYLNKYRWQAGVTMVLAILSRETAVLFPAYLGVVLMAFENQGRFLVRFKKSFFAIMPFAGVAIVYGILRLTVLNFQNTLNFYQQQNIYSENLLYRVYTFFHALVVYIRLIIWPIGLHMDRDIPVSTHIWDPWSWLGVLIVIVCVGWLVFLYRRGLPNIKEEARIKKQESRKTTHDSRFMIHASSFNVWFFGLGIFFVNLLPTSGIIPINARIYEHWLYFSLFGFFTITAFYLDKILSFFKNKNSKLYPLLIIFFIIYCLFLGIQTIRRNLLWSNTEKFYLNILKYEPEDVRVINNLGNWYSDHGNNDLAKPLYERAITIDPNQPALYHNLGNIARDSGQLDRAEELYKKAISTDPTFHYAYGNLAQLYLNQNKITQALEMLEQLQKIYPTVQTQQNIEILQKALRK
ncbi:MAG: tetratricopeptide repeat protein [bacterium]|nr:tetratricopeptide repeat protein [bacterium]